MISIYNVGEKRHSVIDDIHSQNNLPVPFNIPNVLNNLLFEEIGIEFNRMQKDMLETLRFSYNALMKMQSSYIAKTEEFTSKLIKNPDDEQLRKEHQELQLDMLQAQAQFKDIVVAMSELLQREQYEKLLEFSNIPS
ncbi:MAG: hypothetical protein JXQ67_07040 [Campylobacterales bacterium]|nr:hypothetical protein [Campylobacterales bacterium]